MDEKKLSSLALTLKRIDVKTFAVYFLGNIPRTLFSDNPPEVRVTDRDLQFGFSTNATSVVFYDIVTATFVNGATGKEIATKSEKVNTVRYYLGGTIFPMAHVRENHLEESDILKTWENAGITQVVQDSLGGYHAFWEGDQIVSLQSLEDGRTRVGDVCCFSEKDARASRLVPEGKEPLLLDSTG